MNLKPDIPFRYRRFTVDGEPIDIETFISDNSKTFEEAVVIRSDLMDLLPTYHMYFHFTHQDQDIYRME